MSENIETRPYEVLILGLQASGKTTLLASMSRTLSLLRPHTGFRLEACDPDQNSELDRIYESIIKDENWAPGTSKTTEWLFECSVNSSKGDYPVLNVSYIDAPGGMLDEDGKGTEASKKFLEHIDSADIFLFILNGHKILDLMNNVPDADAFLYHDVFTVLKKIQKKSSTPMHFVITKWDLLKSAGYSLPLVKDRLLADKNFSDTVATREGIVRLIPVSALGDNFARWNGEKMVKISGRGEPVPYFVEIPLACILVDQFNSQVRQRINEMRGELHTKRFSWLPTREFGLKAAVTISGGGAQFLQNVAKINPILMGSTIGITTLLEVYSNWDKNHKSRIKEIKNLRELRNKSLITIQNQQEAVDSAILSCTMLVKQFELKYPDSVLDPREVRARNEKREML